MSIPVRELFKRFVFFVIFIILLFIVASGYQWLRGIMSPFDSNAKPMGDAVKVFNQQIVTVDQWTIPDRLLWFFSYGE